MAAIVIIVTVSLMGSFVCSLCEAALYAVTPTRVEQLRASGARGGRKLAELRDRVDDAIAGILTFNTITHTIGAAWAGALVGELYGNYWLGIFFASFTLAILFLTEIVPKSIGVAWAGVLAPRLAWTIQVLVWAVWPLAKLSTLVMRCLTHRAPGNSATEEEIMVMADLAAEGGAILPEESRWVKNVLRLNDVTSGELMTPSDKVYSLPADLPLGRVKLHADHWVHSRLPVTGDRDPEQVLGIVERRLVFNELMRSERTRNEQTKTLRDLMQPVLFVAAGLRGHQLLDLLITRRQQLAMVTNECGSLIGVVSLEDVLQYLLGRPLRAGAVPKSTADNIPSPEDGPGKISIALRGVRGEWEGSEPRKRIERAKHETLERR